MKQIVIILSILLAGCSPNNNQAPIIEAQISGTEASFRALSVVNENIAWVSGSGGTVLKTTNGGSNWQNVSDGVPDSIDFRDIEAFSDKEAIILSAGSPGLVLRTIDGGDSWDISYQDDRPEIFFDAMGFWNDKDGIAFGDAINGKIELITTGNGGKSWQQVAEELRPDAKDGEGGFAASGTCLITYGDSSVWIALGIPESRVIVSHDRGMNWETFESPMAQSTGSGGIFSLGFNSSDYGLAIGGDYRDRASTNKLLAVTQNGGKSWDLIENHKLNGQKAAVTPLPGTTTWLSTGATGVNISYDNGQSWSLIDSTGYYTVQMANRSVGYLSGPKGRVARIKLP